MANAGTVTVELSLDDKPYKQKLSEMLASTEATGKGIETSWKYLGVKNDTTYDTMRRSYENALTLIKNSTSSTSADILRAEQAKNEKIKSLNEQQFGAQTSALSALKSHYFAVTAAIAVSVGAITKAWDMAKAGADFEESRGILENLTAKYKTTADAIVEQMDRASDHQIKKSELMSVALAGIAKGLNPEQLINLADAAEILGDSVGKSAAVALRELTEALETGRTKGLKTYLGTTLDLESAFGDLASKLTSAEKTQAMYNMTMISAISLQGQQTKTVDDAADRIAQVEKRFSDATLSLSRFMKEMVVAGLDILSFKGAINEATDDVGMLSAYLDKGTAATAAAVESKKKDADATAALIAPYKEQIESLKKIITGRKDEGEAAKKSASEKEAAEKSILEAVRKSKAEIEGIGASQYEKDIARINSEADKFRAAHADKVSIAKFTAAEISLAEAKRAEDFKKLGDKSTEEFLLAQEKMREEEDKRIRDEYDKEKKLADDLKVLGDKGLDEFLAAMQTRREEEDKTTRDLYEAEKKLSIERIKMEADIYKDIRGYAVQHYESQKRLIDDKARMMKQSGVDEVAIARWVTEENRRALLAQASQSDNFFSGVNSGFANMEATQKHWGQAGIDLVNGIWGPGGAVSSTLTDFFTDVFKGQLKSAEDYFTAFKDSIISLFAKMVAEMATKWLMLEALKAGKAAWGWLTAEKGMWEVPSGGTNGEVPIVAHEGEMVLPKQVASGVRNYFQGGEGIYGAGAAGGALIGAYIGGKAGQWAGSYFGETGGNIGGALGSYGGAYVGSEAGTALAAYIAGVSAADQAAIAAAMNASYAELGIGAGEGASAAGTAASSSSMAGPLAFAAFVAAMVASGSYGAATMKRPGMNPAGPAQGSLEELEALRPWDIDTQAELYALQIGMGLKTGDIGKFTDLEYARKLRISYLLNNDPFLKPEALWGGYIQSRGGSIPSGAEAFEEGQFSAWFRDQAAFGDAVSKVNKFAYEPMPVYQRGIDYVPRTGPAILHEGERVIPKDQNRGGGSPVFHIYLDGQEIKGRMRIVADKTITERNRRGVNPTMEIYS